MYKYLYRACLGWSSLFFITAHMAICLGLVKKTVLVTHYFFGYCWTVLAQYWGLLSLILPHSMSRLWSSKKLGHKFSKGIFTLQSMSCSEGEGKKKKKVEWAGVSWWFCLSRRLLLIDWWDIVRGGESLPLHHFPSTHFLSLFNCLYLDPLVFSLCLFLFSPLYCWKDQGSEKKIVWVSSWRRLTQHNIIKVFFLVL